MNTSLRQNQKLPSQKVWNFRNENNKIQARLKIRRWIPFTRNEQIFAKTCLLEWECGERRGRVDHRFRQTLKNDIVREAWETKTSSRSCQGRPPTEGSIYTIKQLKLLFRQEQGSGRRIVPFHAHQVLYSLSHKVKSFLTTWFQVNLGLPLPCLTPTCNTMDDGWS